MILLFIYLLFIVILGIHYKGHRKEYEGRLMFLPALIPLIITAGSAIYQGIKGAKQKREARKMQEQADSMDASNLAEARRMALSGLPAQEYEQALQQIYRNQSTSLSALRDKRMALAGTTSVQQATNDALTNLASQDAKLRLQNQYNALGQANKSAAIKADRAAQERYSGEALTGAAIQNVFNTAGAASSLFGSGGGEGSGLFGNSSEGRYNRMLLGSSPVKGGSAGGAISSGLSGRALPSLRYSKPY